MLTIFADNTMISGSIADRQDMPVVTTSTISRGLERLVVHLLRVVVPVVVAPAHAYCASHAAAGCQRITACKRWQLGLSGKRPLGIGQPMGPGNLDFINPIAG